MQLEMAMLFTIYFSCDGFDFLANVTTNSITVMSLLEMPLDSSAESTYSL